MGNACFGKQRSNKGVVHPVVHRVCDQGVTIKVRMARGQLNELIGKVDMSNGNSELGRLIVQECSNGRLHACVVAAAAGDDSNKFSRGLGLRPIQEHSEEFIYR